MAEHLELEELMICALKRDFKSDQAQGFISRYFSVKDKLYNELLSWIRANEPMLSDHGPGHIDNVLNNAYQLLAKEAKSLADNDKNIAKYKGIDLYILCMSILFHDVGNFFQRKFHNQNIPTVLNDLFSQFFYGEFSRAKTHIVSAGRAHAGKNTEGGKDTLKYVSETEHCGGVEVQLRDIAAIVRLADELAEGPQRTCQYMSSKKKITPESEIYHRYASCTHIGIDAKNGRIILTYEIELNFDVNQNMSKADREKLKEFLEFIHERIFKLDQERKYCGFYCETLKSIKETQVSFNFLNQGLSVDFKREPLVLNDLTVPGDKAKNIIEGRDDLKIDCVINELANSLSSMSLQPKTSEKDDNCEDRSMQKSS
jgi:hypothetical protein